MRAFLVLLAVGVASAVPYYSEESSFDHHDDWKYSSGSDADSSSFESSEVALAGGDWRQDALSHMNMLRARANLPPYQLDEGLNAMSQKWAENIACNARHDKIDLKYFYAESLAGVDTRITGDSKSKMAEDGVQRWYEEVKLYDCRSMRQGQDKQYYYSVGHYMNNMSKKYNVVGFGLAFCPGKTSGQLVARFNGRDGYADKMQAEQMKAQGLDYYTFNQLDNSKYVPCPKSEFSPY